MNKDDEKIVRKIRTGDEEAFEDFFFEYYTQLCKYSYKIVKSQSIARDAVQEVFIKIWKNHTNWDVYHSLKVYLYQAVRNQSLNLLEKMNRQQDLSKKLSEEAVNEMYEGQSMSQENDYNQSDYLIGLVKNVWDIAEEMPERRRTVFTLHRRNGLSYKEIGDVMGIKRKTVENHMTIALKTIRNNIDSKKLELYKTTL